MVLFGVDVIGLIIGVFPQIIPTIINFVPPALGNTGDWANCISANGVTAEICQGLVH